MTSIRLVAMAGLALGVMSGSTAHAQMAPAASRSVPLGISSGDVEPLFAARNGVPVNQLPIEQVSEAELSANTILWAEVVDVPDAAWVRL